MGLFSKKETCCICNNIEGKKKIFEGYICKQCLRLCSIPFQVRVNKNTTRQSILAEIENNKKNKSLLNNFNPTKQIGHYIEFDEQKKQWLIPDGFFGKKVNAKVYDFKDIIEYELLEDGDSVTKGGLGRAVVGGALLGGVGAIVGSVTGKKKTKSVINSLKIKITINDTSNPVIYINLITTKVKSNSSLYKMAYSQAQTILSMLSIITKSDENTAKEENKDTLSVADEVIKLKKLKDEGILTEEEFNIQKGKILNR